MERINSFALLLGLAHDLSGGHTALVGLHRRHAYFTSSNHPSNRQRHQRLTPRAVDATVGSGEFIPGRGAP
jgi:hypothetical protein